MNKPIYIVDGARTPFLKSTGPDAPKPSDFSTQLLQQLLKRQPFKPEDVSEVILGYAVTLASEPNIGRITALRAGCGKSVPGFTVQRNCASGMQAIDSAMKDIALGRADLVFAGGVDCMGHAPLTYKKIMVKWFSKMMAAKVATKKMKNLSKLPLKSLLDPNIALMQGLTDPVCGLLMGQTAENLAFDFDITRKDMDEFALMSHKRALYAQETDFFNDEIVPLYDPKTGEAHVRDDGVRADTDLQKLGKLRPFFDKKFGGVTAGNSSQVTDGASMLLLASEEAIKKHNLLVIGKISAVEWAACDGGRMGLGPVYASSQLMKNNNLTLSDIDFWELNEAFAAQVIACQKAFNDEKFCKENLGLDNAWGELSSDTVNVNGGAVSIGHPIGGTGARLVLTLLRTLKRKQANKGIATLCIGGGQGGAMLVENVSAVSGE